MERGGVAGKFRLISLLGTKFIGLNTFCVWIELNGQQKKGFTFCLALFFFAASQPFLKSELQEVESVKFPHFDTCVSYHKVSVVLVLCLKEH